MAVFVLARAVPFARARVGLDLDSFDYLDLATHKSMAGVLAAHRPPVYLLTLKLVGENRQLVSWLQLVGGLAAWVCLAFATARNLQTRPARYIGFVAMLLLGSSLDMGQWDRVIGTESLSISLGVLIVAATLWWWGRWSRAGIATISLLIVLWALLRDANALVAGAAGAVVVIAVVIRRMTGWQWLLAVGVIAIVASIGAVVSGDIGNRWQQPTQNVVTFRVLQSPERTDYFLRRGLPVSPVEAARIRGRCVNPVGAFLCEKLTDAAFYDWIEHRARPVYVRSWFAFPATTLWEPLAHVRRITGTRVPVAEITGTRLQASAAATVESVVFPRSPRVLLVWIFLLAFGTAFLDFRAAPRILGVGIALVLLAYVHLWVVWTGDAVELERHGLVAALQIVLALSLLSLGLIDAFLARFVHRNPQPEPVGRSS